METRMRKLIGRRKSRLAEMEPKKETFVYPEIRTSTSSRKNWTEEERSMLEAVVAAHPTINDRVPTGKAYWKLFREQQPNFLKDRNNKSLGCHWNDMNRSQGENKKKLSPLEQEAEDLMDEIMRRKSTISKHCWSRNNINCFIATKMR